MATNTKIVGVSTHLLSCGSPSHGDNHSALPSLYQFSTRDAASTVNHSKLPIFDNGVVDNPPPKVMDRCYAPPPSPLQAEKRQCMSGKEMSSPKNHVPKCPRSSRRPRSNQHLCMDHPTAKLKTTLEGGQSIACIFHDPKAKQDGPLVKDDRLSMAPTNSRHFMKAVLNDLK